MRCSPSFANILVARPADAALPEGCRKFMIAKFTVVMAIWMVVLVAPAPALQSNKLARIGFLTAGVSTVPPGFVQKLRDLGYVEGNNIGFELQMRRSPNSDWSEPVAQLIKLKVDIIVADGSGPATAAMKATKTIPIVMTSSTDPVSNGLVASLAQPGGNVTGLSSVSGELGGKLLDILKEIMPRLSRVVIPGPPLNNPTQQLFMKESEAPARAFKVELIHVTTRGPEEFPQVFQTAAKRKAQALMVRIPPTILPAQRQQFVELAAKHRLPAIYQATNWIDAGGLLSYGADRNYQFQRTAVYVDKILKGAKPAELPVEQPMKFEFVINLKAAKQIGLTIPPNVLVRADRVIR
jgi:putative ABC transport system substrate-binding protein